MDLVDRLLSGNVLESDRWKCKTRATGGGSVITGDGVTMHVTIGAFNGSTCHLNRLSIGSISI